MAKKKGDDDGPSAPAWMVTFSDLVTLLLTFFVLLLTMASMDKTKFSKMTGSLKSAFGVIELITQKDVAMPTIQEDAPVQDDLVQRVYRKMLVQLKRLQLDQTIKLVKDRGAVVLRVDETILFLPGQTRIRPEAHETLRKVAELVRPLPMNMRIEGHSDDSGSEMSNWDVSIARSISVLKFFVTNDLMDLKRLSAVGYGSQQPVVPNDSAEGRARNRRVEFFLESQGNYTDELPYLIDAKQQYPF